MNKYMIFLTLLGMMNIVHANRLNITNNTNRPIHLIGERVQGQGQNVSVASYTYNVNAQVPKGQLVAQLDSEIAPGKTYSQEFSAGENLSNDVRLRQDNDIIGIMLVDGNENYDVSIEKSPYDGALTLSSMPASSKK